MRKDTKIIPFNTYLCQMSLLEEKSKNTTPISQLGEFGLIDHLTKNIKLKNEKYNKRSWR